MDMLAETNGWNDYLREKKGRAMTPENVSKTVDELFDKAGIKPGSVIAERLKTNLALRGEAARNWAVAGIALGDKDGNFQSTTPEQQAAYVSWKFLQEDRQAAMRGFHPDSVFSSTYGPDPADPSKNKTTFGDLNGVVGKKLLEGFDGGHVKNWSRSREFNTVLIEQLKAAVNDKTGKTNKGLQDAYTNFPGFHAYVNAVIRETSPDGKSDKGSSTGLELTGGKLVFATGGTAPTGAPAGGGTP
jgi:hypothetical protein